MSDFAKSIGAVPAEAPVQPTADDVAARLGAVPVEAAPSTAGVGVLEAARLGLKKGLAPHAVTPEEYRAPESTGEAVVDAAFNVLTGVAAGAATGAAVGSVVPGAGTAAGLVGGALYALYSGIGNEVSRSRAEGKEFSAGRAALSTALEANPLFKSASKLAVAARIAGQVAGTAGLEAAYTDDPKRAAGAATFAALTAPLLWLGMRAPQAGKVVQGVTKQGAEAVEQLLHRPDGQQIIRNVSQLMDDAGDVVRRAPEAPPLEFQRWVLKGGGTVPKSEAAEQFATLKERVSRQQLDSAWELWNRAKFTAQEAARVGAEYAKRHGEPLPDLGVTRRWLADGKYVARKVDEHLDLDLEGALDAVSRANEKANLVAAGYVSQANELAREAQRLKVDPKTLGRALTGAEPDAHVPQDLLAKYQTLVDNLDNQLRDLGHPASGLSAQTLPGPEAAVAARAGRSTQEFDVNRLLSRHINEGLRAAVVAPAVRQVASLGQALEAAGMPRAAAWVDRYAAHMSGDVGAVPRAWTEGMDAVRRAGLEWLEDKPGSVAGHVAEATPRFLAWLNRAVYPATLGGNFRAAARNTLQTFATTAPELGGAYGYGVVGRAMRDVGKRVGQGIRGLEAGLAAKGQLGGLLNEVEPAAVGVRRKVTRALGAVNELSMKPYQWSDVANRSIALRAGELWAADVVAGKPGALRALNRLSAGAKSRALQAWHNAPDTLGDVLGDYLVGKTQFRYGRAQQSQAQRELGSAFSMFTKWPLMAAGDLLEVAQRKDLRAVADRLAPLLALLGTSAALRHGDQPSEHAWLNYVVGDPVEWSPYASLAGLGGLTGGPLVKAAVATPQVASDVVRGQGGDALRTAVRAGLKTFVPPLSQVLNEVDRVAAARGEERTPSRELVNRLTGGPQ